MVISTESLRERIEREYASRGDSLGWRLLYSPSSVLTGARVAFVGLNPGGSTRPADHAEFAMAAGSAYVRENWDAPPGTSKLQRQVLALFRLVGEEPDRVLAGNLVPFRSPSWSDLANRQAALAFGKALWRDILQDVRPRLVIAMGNETHDALSDVLGASSAQSALLSWGAITGKRSQFEGGTLVGIPHLSRFGVITRPESAFGLRQLFQLTN